MTPLRTRTAFVAYFSMEIGLDSSIPTYAGGLGILAGDTIRTAADLEIPLVGVTLLYRHGYFYQHLDRGGRQDEEPVQWPVEDFLDPLSQRVTVEIEGRTVTVAVWRYQVSGLSGFQVPVYLLDTDLPENTAWDRTLTHTLYGGDLHYRLCQEIVLGMGGVQMLRALGYSEVTRFHMNEGHSALLVLALLEELLTAPRPKAIPWEEATDTVREHCIFTTHTPVPAGHDQFPSELAERALGERRWSWLQACGQTSLLNMTDLALRCSRYVNGVAMKHGEVSRELYPGYPIHSITNGIHVATWASPAFQALYDLHLPGWRQDELFFRYAVGIPDEELWDAHMEAKRALIQYVNRETNTGLDAHVLTLGFARRATAYKRPTLIFHDLERLKRIASDVGPLQLVLAGKAHPNDGEGKELIRRVFEIKQALNGHVAIAYLENYDMTLAKLICAGVDVWLNTPLPPLEASGTSGMKAAINGVPSLSVPDGWWLEGHVEGVTGWNIGTPVAKDNHKDVRVDGRHAAALYDKLTKAVLPCFYKDRAAFIRMMRHTIALNGSFFNSHRMFGQYLRNAYRQAGTCFRNSGVV